MLPSPVQRAEPVLPVQFQGNGSPRQAIDRLEHTRRLAFIYEPLHIELVDGPTTSEFSMKQLGLLFIDTYQHILRIGSGINEEA